MSKILYVILDIFILVLMLRNRNADDADLKEVRRCSRINVEEA